MRRSELVAASFFLMDFGAQFRGLTGVCAAVSVQLFSRLVPSLVFLRLP